MKNVKIATILGAVLALSSLSMPGYAREEGACKEDAKKLCGEMKPGGGAIHDCLKSHESELSEGCKHNITEAKEKMKGKREEIKKACEADLKQYCSNVTPGEGRELACLKSYEDKLSAGCKEKFPKHHKGMHKEHKGTDTK